MPRKNRRRLSALPPLARLQAAGPELAEPRVFRDRKGDVATAPARRYAISSADQIRLAEAVAQVDYRRQHPEHEDLGPARSGLVLRLDAGTVVAPRRTASSVANPGRIRYDAELVRDRLAEAVAVLRRMPVGRGAFPSGLRSGHPEVVKTRAELWELMLHGKANTRITRVLPSPEELRLLDDRLPWLYAVVDPERRRALVLRLMGVSLRKVAEGISAAREARGERGVSHEWVRRAEVDALGLIARELNQCKN
jgi:hypothetical protein